jgi:hypothetical protein
MISPTAWTAARNMTVQAVFGGSGSDWVVRVEQAGVPYLVKASSRRVTASRGEASCWEAWAAVPGLPRLIEWDAEHGVSVRTWVEGSDITDPAAYAVAAGQLARRLHVPAPETMQPLTDWTKGVRRRFLAAGTPESQWALHALAQAPGDGTVVLHGDYRIANMLDANGLTVIDPYGYRGSASFDLATYIVTAYGCDRDDISQALQEGYGPVPHDFSAMMGWFAVTHAGFLRSINEPDPTLEAWITTLMQRS